MPFVSAFTNQLHKTQAIGLKVTANKNHCTNGSGNFANYRNNNQVRQKLINKDEEKRNR